MRSRENQNRSRQAQRNQQLQNESRIKALQSKLEKASAATVDLWLANREIDLQRLTAPTLPTSPIVRAHLARQEAERGEFASAMSLLEQLIVEDLPRHALIDVGTTWQLLGRPATGLSVISGFANLPNETVQRTSSELLAIEYQRLKLRLLMDAGRIAEANALPCLKELADSDRPTDLLLLAEFRQLIGWNEGASKLLGRLSANMESLRPHERAKLEIMQAKASGDPNLLMRVAGLGQDPGMYFVRGWALFVHGEQLREQGAIEEAERYYQEVVSHFSEKLPMHFLSFVARLKLVNGSLSLGKRESALRQREQLWDDIEAVKEFGTLNAGWCAASLLQSEIRNDEATRLIRVIEQSLPSLDDEPYLLRAILLKRVDLVFEASDAKLGYDNADRLVAIEEKSWGAESLEYTYALTVRPGVEQDHGGKVEMPPQVLLNLKRMQGTFPRSPALAFLVMAAETLETQAPVSITPHEWLRLYQKHRFSADSIQREMVEHTCRSLAAEFPKVGERLQAALQKFGKP